MDINVKTHHIVYEITNTINGKKYIGKHSTFDLNDGYLGSGLAIQRAVAKYGKEAFEKIILRSFDTSEEAFTYEKEIITKEIVESDLYYNMSFGGIGGGIIFTESVRKSMSDAAIKRCAEGRHSQLGKPKTKTQIEKMNNTNHEKWSKDPTSHNRYGTKHSDEARKNLSIAARKRYRSPEEKVRLGKSTGGSSWYNNGTINKRIKSGEVAPEGYTKGRLTSWQ